MQKVKEKLVIEFKEIKRNEFLSQFEKENFIKDVNVFELVLDIFVVKEKLLEKNGINGKIEVNGVNISVVECQFFLISEFLEEDVNLNLILFVMLVFLKNVLFCIFVVNNVLWNFGIVIFLIFGFEYFMIIGFFQKELVILIFFFSGGFFVGCVLGGVFGNILKINWIYFFIVVNLGVGIVGFFIFLEIVYFMVGLVIVGVIWGIMFGLILGFLVVVIVDLVGIYYLGDVMGFLMLVNGVGCIIGLLIGGKLNYLLFMSVRYLNF